MAKQITITLTRRQAEILEETLRYMTEVHGLPGGYGAQRAKQTDDLHSIVSRALVATPLPARKVPA